MGYEISKAAYNDIDEIFRVMTAVAGTIAEPAYFVSSDRSYVEEHIEDSGVTYLMKDNGRMMGFLIIDFPGDEEHNLGLDIGLSKTRLAGVVHMDTIVVLPEYRGQGLQKIILAYGEEQMKQAGYSDLMATVHPDNAASLKSFQSAGYLIEKTKLKYNGYLRHILRKNVQPEVPATELSGVEVMVCHYDAFSSVPGKGNPAGVVLAADWLTDVQMQAVAAEMGFNETAFLLKSDQADLRIRYFTPGHEMNLCGHATVASIYCLHERGMLSGKTDIIIETRAGVLPLTVKTSGNEVLIHMTQAPPVFTAFEGDIKALAEAMGLSRDEIDDTLPVVYGSTGTWTLLVPIKELSSFLRMKPQNQQFPAVLEQMPGCSVHPFCFQASGKGRQVHSRHFSSPYSGTTEDPVTGTASGVIGCYYSTYMEPAAEACTLVLEQGQELEKDGEVYVYVYKNQTGVSVTIAGTAVFVGEMAVYV